jgi:O-antigen ligase
MVKALKGLLLLYSVALVCSVAAMEIISVLLTLTAMVLFVIHKDWQKPNFTSLGVCLLVFNGAIFLSLIFSPADSVNWILGLKTFKYSMWAWALAYLLTRYLSFEEIKSWLPYWFSLILILSLYTIFQFFYGVDFFRSQSKIVAIGAFYRPTGFFSMSLTLAYCLAMGAISLVPLAFHQNKTKYASLFWGIALVAMLAVGLTLSRGAWLSYAISLVLVVVLLRSKRLAVASGLALVLVGLVLALNPSVQAKFWNAFDLQDSSQSYRLILWKSYWQIFLDHPFIGTGWLQGEAFLTQAFEKIGQPNFGFKSHAHSNYLQILSGVGIFGIMAYLALIFSGLRAAYRQFCAGKEKTLVNYLGLSLLATQVLFHLGGLTESNLIDAELTHFLFSQWAILMSLFRVGRFEASSD